MCTRAVSDQALAVTEVAQGTGEMIEGMIEEGMIGEIEIIETGMGGEIETGIEEEEGAGIGTVTGGVGLIRGMTWNKSNRE